MAILAAFAISVVIVAFVVAPTAAQSASSGFAAVADSLFAAHEDPVGYIDEVSFESFYRIFLGGVREHVRFQLHRWQ